MLRIQLIVQTFRARFTNRFGASYNMSRTTCNKLLGEGTLRLRRARAIDFLSIPITRESPRLTPEDGDEEIETVAR